MTRRAHLSQLIKAHLAHVMEHPPVRKKRRALFHNSTAARARQSPNFSNFDSQTRASSFVLLRTASSPNPRILESSHMLHPSSQVRL